jgi:hypothetical protein
VADFGCGDAKIARSVPNVVHSFDLVALNSHVIPCDMSHVSFYVGMNGLVLLFLILNSSSVESVFY